MHSVTSNAVYNAITGIIRPVEYIKFKSNVSFSGKQYIFNGMFFIQGDITTRQAIAQYDSIATITTNSLKTPFALIGVPYIPNVISNCYVLNNSGWSLIIRSAVGSNTTININYCCSLP